MINAAGRSQVAGETEWHAAPCTTSNAKPQNTNLCAGEAGSNDATPWAGERLQYGLSSADKRSPATTRAGIARRGVRVVSVMNV